MPDQTNQSPFEIISPAKSKKSGSKGVIVAVLIVVFLILSVVAGVLLVRQRQLVQEKAAVAKCPAAEACPVPGHANTLRNCTPPEADGSPDEQLCTSAGRIGSCGGKQYCCPKANGAWTTDMSQCAAAGTPTPGPSGTISCSSGFSDNFDSSSIDTTKWNKFGDAKIVSGQLVVTLQAASPNGVPAGVTALKLLSGDFTMYFDVPSVSKTGDGYGAAMAAFANSAQSKILTVGKTLKADGTVVVGANIASTSNESKTANVGASDKITFRIERKSGVISVYYKTGADYTLLNTFSTTFSDDMTISLTGISGGNPSPVTVINYDNFLITCLASTPAPSPTASISPTPTGSASPTPSTAATTPPATQATARPVPVTGTDWPTVVGAGVGVFVIIASILMAL